MKLNENITIMNIKILPLEIEKIIYNYAFSIDADFLVKELSNGYNITQFIEEHSSYLIDKIDWLDFFLKMLDQDMKNYYNYSFIRNNLRIFTYLVEEKQIKLDEYQLYIFYQGVRAFGGDDHYEYILDNLPEVENFLIKITEKYN